MNLVFDIEADGLEPTVIFCIVAIDADTQEVYSFDNTQIREGCEFLSTATKLIGHNIIGYDLPALLKIENLDLSDKKIVDTLVLSRLFDPVREGGHGLEAWGYRLKFLKGSYGEDNEQAWSSFTPEMLEYCINDVKLNLKVYDRLKFESKGFSAKSVIIEHEVAKVIHEQRETGFLIDCQKCMLLLAELNDELNEVKDKVHEEFKPTVTVQTLNFKYTKTGEFSRLAVDQDGIGVRLTDKEYAELELYKRPIERKTFTEFNLGSRKQIGEYLINFGWKPTQFTPTGQPVVDEITLTSVKDIPQASMIARYLMLQKRIAQITSWLKEVKEDNRIHGFVNSNGAITSRMTHSYPNTAQIPSCSSPYGAECRSCWIVPDGYKLVGIDASGLELRMLAHHMNDKEYINEILNGDIHTANQKFAGLESRNQAKTFVYSVCYGAGDAKVGAVVGGSREDGKRLKQRFFASVPAFKAVKDRVSREATKGFIKAIDGRKLTVRSPHSALNTLLQGDGAIIMKQALIIFNDKIIKGGYDAKFVANVHDEWQLEVRKDIADEVGRLGVLSIKETTCALKLNCPLDGEYNVGNNWSETH